MLNIVDHVVWLVGIVLPINTYCNTHDVAFDIPPVGYERFPPVGTGTIRKDDLTLIRGTESNRNERDPEAV
jgi:hypothetical protein